MKTGWIGAINIPRVAGKIGGMGDIQHLALGVLQLLRDQRRLAAAHHDQRRGRAIHRPLGIIETDRLVEQMDFATLRMQITQRPSFRLGLRQLAIGNPALVDGRAAQEARAVVVVVQHHFQHQRANLIAVAHQRKDQPVGLIQLGPAELAMAGMHQLLHLGCAEIAPSDGFLHLAISGGDV